MLPAPHTLVWLIAIAVTLWILRTVAWRLCLTFAPASIRIRAADGTLPPPDGFSDAAAVLTGHGFVPIGARIEHPRFGRAVANFDFAHPAQRTFATVYGVRKQSVTYLLSPLEGGELVRTAVHPDRPFEAALADHLQRCDGHAREGRYDSPERLSLAREWFEGPGAAAVRRQQLAPVLWSLVTLGMVLWALLIHL